MAEETDRVSTVVGIGASAGGLGVLRQLLARIPADTGLAYVVVVHLAPDHRSHLADLLQLHAAMPVHQVTESLPIAVDNVYVIPPGRNLSALDTHLRLSELEEHRRNRSPIDHFFRTLAATHDGHAIGVVLSGTGGDGTSGLAAIKERGGLAIVQDPAEAEYDGMPRSAIAAGVADIVAPVAEIADRLVRIAHDEPRLPVIDDGTATAPDAQQLLQRIFALIRARTGNDVSGYKASTLWRRIRRRMQLHQVSEVEAYVEILRHDHHEVERLFEDLLISVTAFFRDPEVFDVLATEVVPRLFEGKGPQDSVRVWSAGCSTGEEAYSLAMLLAEHAATVDDPPQLQLFATDLHAPSLQRARDGVYPTSIEADVSAERLRRFFVGHNGSYRVREELRKLVLFAPHGLLKDPPFSHLGLISCRNLLIYLQRDTQARAVSTFHYALDPGGHLVLGTSETLDRSQLFTTVDKAHCIFRRRDVANREPPVPAVAPGAARPTSPVSQPLDGGARPDTGYGALHARLVEQDAPASVLVDAEHRVVHYSAGAGRYLTHPEGGPTNDVFRLARPELRLELRTSIHAARGEHRAVSGRPVVLAVDGSDRTVLVRAIPAREEGAEGFVLVVFDEVEADPPGPDGGDGSRLHRMEAELDVTRQRLQSIIERYETGQEEMQAANEELQSANEELRSTMEELETSKEELQSMNEELATLNQENRLKVEELSMLSSDLQNLLTATDIATLFLDRALRIVRFTPPVTGIFNIVNGDRGRPLTDFSHRLRFEGLPAEALHVLDTLIPAEHEIQSSDGRWLLTRILPYRTSDDRIEGVVITFVDITRRLEAETSLRASERRLRLALDASAMGSWWWDPASGHSGADTTARELVGAGPDQPFMAALEQRLAEPERTRLRQHLEADTRRPIQLRLNGGSPSDLVVELHARRGGGDDDDDDDDEPGSHRRHLGTILDVTDRVATTTSLAQRGERLGLLSEAAAHLLRGVEPTLLLDRLFERLSGLLDLEIYEHFVFEANRRPRLVACAGLPAGVEAAGGIGADLCAQAVASRAAVVRNDVASATDAATAGARAERVTAVACIPLLVGPNVLGALAVGTRRGSFDDETVELIRTIVDYLAVAEQRLQSEEELRALNESLEAAVAARTRELQEREQQLRALVEASFQAVWSADDSGRIRHSTPAWQIDEGWRQEWPAGGWIDAVHPAERDGIADAWAGALRQRTLLEADVRLGTGEAGPWRWATVRAVPLDGPDGEPNGWVGTILDIDERTRANLQLRTLAADLARAEAHERQRIAEVLHDDLQQLLYGAQMRLGMVREYLAGGQVEAAAAQADDADRFIEDGVALARHLSGDLAPQTLHDSDLGESIRWLADQMGDRHGLAVAVDVEGSLDVADTDVRLLLYQCLQELLFNVVKHAATHAAAVSARGGSDGSLVLMVADEGQGFDPAAGAGLSGDGVSGDGAGGDPEDGGVGDGQGLANVARRLGLVGGSLELRSVPGDGTTATIFLPPPA